MKKITVITLIMMCVVVTSGCKDSLFADRFTVESQDDYTYDYREMYVNGDTKDLDGKELDAFNTASKIYSLYIEKCQNDYEKVKAAHDYIVKNCTYNKEAVDNDSLVDDDFSVYGVLVKGIAVCEGYAKAFMMLMDIADIECIMVTGNAGEDNVLHAWNMVKLEDEWYHIDVTFDDPYPETEEIVYLYFNVSDEIISKDHTWNNSVTPKADDNRYDLIAGNEERITTIDEFRLLIGDVCNKTRKYVAFVWMGKGMISEEQWRSAINNSVIASVKYSCVGVEGRRLYMVNFGY